MTNGALPLPTISVVIPNYNRADAVGVAVHSVLRQSFADFEIIVVDDGSTDDSLAHLAAIDDSRLRVIAQPNAGAASARNYGIDLARGRYVAFLDSDDEYLPDHFARMMAVLDDQDDVAAYSAVIADRGRGVWIVKPPRSIAPGEHMAMYLMCDRGFVQTSGLIVARKMLADTRYRPDVAFGDDIDFAVRLYLDGCRFRMSAHPTVRWADDPREDRLSAGGQLIDEQDWLRDLRPRIPPRAYHGYRGWHVAKGMFHHNAWRATKLYLRAAFGGSYSPRMALVVFLQIFMSQRHYRRMADTWISLRTALGFAPREAKAVAVGRSGGKSIA